MGQVRWHTWGLHKQEAYGPGIVRVPGIARGPGMVRVDHVLLKVGGCVGNGVKKPKFVSAVDRRLFIV